jgi:tRNA(Ile)-lysidine synthase
VITAPDLAQRVLGTIRRHGLLHGGEFVLAAVSGGADSVALLDVLGGLRPALGLTLACVHVHHGLRPEADADAEFVRCLAETLDVPFYLERVTVRRERPWDGLEAEARRARYAALEARARALGAPRIATGHTADDQAETVVMRLLAGAGPRGLGGIAAARGAFIRPLLEARRADVLDHLVSRGMRWIEDRTNRDPRFLRNRVRHDVLPSLAASFGPRVVESLCRGAALHRGLVADLERWARAELDRMATRGPAGIVLPAAELTDRPAELALQILLVAAEELGDARPRRGSIQRVMRRLLSVEAPRRPLKIGSLSMERSGAWLRVGPAFLPALVARPFPVPGAIDLPEVGLRLAARRFERPPHYTPPRESRCVAFDADRLPHQLAVRSRRAGERFSPFGGPVDRRLKTVLIDAGVPRWERPRVPLLEAAGDVVWVAGVRRGQRAPVSKDTARILEVTLEFL